MSQQTAAFEPRSSNGAIASSPQAIKQLQTDLGAANPEGPSRAAAAIMSVTFDLPVASDITDKSQVSLSAEGSLGLICFNSFTKVGGIFINKMKKTSRLQWDFLPRASELAVKEG